MREIVAKDAARGGAAAGVAPDRASRARVGDAAISEIATRVRAGIRKHKGQKMCRSGHYARYQAFA
ncbi:hypothetical protein [Burkholderia sp. Ac-20379]|uniref:hypothetical protein n=1 Tax=Burkholderia sp. Ac-20379 TaxID=2703900 RepID=UPI00197DCACB|nr:hypothetical protein [Burkholderia sp. Ac-20379]